MLHIIPSDKFTTNVFCVLIRLPLCREGVTQTALLPPLLSRGSAKYPTMRDIRLVAESLGGAVFDAQIVKKGEEQVLQFFLEYADNGLSLKKRGLDFLQEVIQYPLVEEKGFYAPHVKGECENLKNRIIGRINNKSEYAKLKCIEAMCQGEPFGLYGDGYVEDLPNVSPEGLLSRYHNIKNSYPMEFIALGKWNQTSVADKNWLEEEIVARFGDIGSKKMKIPTSILRPARPKYQVIRLDHGSAQGRICIGLRGDFFSVGMDFIHFQLVNEILGGGSNSKLFANVREKESLCYAIFSVIYRFKSLMCILAGTEIDKLEYVLQLAEKEVEDLKQGHFSKEEFNNAKESLSKRWRAMLDNPSACIDFYASQHMIGDHYTAKELLLQLHKATPDGVLLVASRLNIDTVVTLT